MQRGIFEGEEMSTDIPSLRVARPEKGARGVAESEETMGTMGDVQGMQRTLLFSYEDETDVSLQ